MVGNPGACRNRLSWTGSINHGFLWKHWMGSGLLVFATCCLCLILWFLISCKAMANFSSSLGMLYVKKNHGSFVFLIEFVKEVIAIKISTQPYFPHNLILVSKFVWGKEYVYKTNIVIGWKMVYQKKKGGGGRWKRVHQTIIQIVCSLLYPWKNFVSSPKILFNSF